MKPSLFLLYTSHQDDINQIACFCLGNSNTTKVSTSQNVALLLSYSFVSTFLFLTAKIQFQKDRSSDNKKINCPQLICPQSSYTAHKARIKIPVPITVSSFLFAYSNQIIPFLYPLISVPQLLIYQKHRIPSIQKYKFFHCPVHWKQSDSRPFELKLLRKNKSEINIFVF